MYAFVDILAENAARAIIDWCASLGVFRGLISDGPTYFRNETICLVCKGLQVPHHFTLPYTPWSNGAVERLGKELFRVFRYVISELHIRPDEWPDLLLLVQSVLSTAPSPQRARLSPLKSMTGLTETPPVATLYRSSTTSAVTIDDVAREQTLNIDSPCATVSDLRRVIQDALWNNQERQRIQITKGQAPNFCGSDFVLVAREHFSAGEEMSLRWRGAKSIVRPVSDYIYQFEDLRNGLIEDVHASRCKFYHDPSLHTEAITPYVLSSETGIGVQNLMTLYESEEGLLVQVRLHGLPESEDTDELIQKVYEDNSGLLVKLLRHKNIPPNLVERSQGGFLL